MKAMYTVPQVADTTGLGRTKLYEEMTAGRLRFVKVGTRRLIPGPSLMDYVRLLECESGSQSPRVESILALVDSDGRIDVERLPSDATIGDLRAAQELLARSTGSGSAA